MPKHLLTSNCFDAFFRRLYHLNDEKDPAGLSKKPAFGKKFEAKGIQKSIAVGKITCLD